MTIGAPNEIHETPAVEQPSQDEVREVNSVTMGEPVTPRIQTNNIPQTAPSSAPMARNDVVEIQDRKQNAVSAQNGNVHSSAYWGSLQNEAIQGESN